MTLLGLAVPALASQAPQAAPARLVEVTYALVESSAAGEGERPESITATARFEAGTGARVPEPVSAQAGSDGLHLSVGLAPGIWRLNTSAPGFWAPPVEVQVPDGVGPPVALSVKLWPAASLGGRLRVPGHLQGPLEATIESPPGTPVASSVPSTSVGCAVEVAPHDVRWQCVLPATTLDLRLSMPGLVPVYLWDRPLGPDQETTQDLAFRQGSSVAGFVVNAAGDAAGQRCRVKLAAPDGADILGRDAGGRPGISFLAPANERGFFQIVGAPAGSYLLVAEEPAQGRGESTATVSAERETWLDEPIELQPPASVAFELSPPLSPAETPWSLQLLYARDGHQVSRAYPKRKVTEEGRLRMTGLLPGTYRVLIMGRSHPSDRADAVWNSSLIEVHDGFGFEFISIDVSRVNLCGTVLLGDDGLQAHLTVHEMMSGFETSLDSDDAGEFCLPLPRPPSSMTAQSYVDFGIVSDEPPVNGAVREWVNLSEASPTVRIELGDRTLSGTVVDEAGQPATAHVTATLGESPAGEMDTAEDGRFSFSGLRAEPVRVEAWGPRGVAETVLAEPRDSDSEAAPDDLRLVLRSTTTRTARVTTREGPVPGALVLIMPLDILSSPRYMPLRNADQHGVVTFAAPVSARAFGFLASAGGHPVRLGRAEMPAHEWPDSVHLEIPLPREGGTLVVTDVPGLEPEATDGPRPVVVHGGFWLYAESLIIAGAVRQGSSLTVPLIEPGPYAICHLTALQVSLLQSEPDLTGCSRAELPPGGRIRLQATRDATGRQSAAGGQP